MEWDLTMKRLKVTLVIKFHNTEKFNGILFDNKIELYVWLLESYTYNLQSIVGRYLFFTHYWKGGGVEQSLIDRIPFTVETDLLEAHEANFFREWQSGPKIKCFHIILFLFSLPRPSSFHSWKKESWLSLIKAQISQIWIIL